jgi:hypothetical protein
MQETGSHEDRDWFATQALILALQEQRFSESFLTDGTVGIWELHQTIPSQSLALSLPPNDVSVITE